jgi:hypothetical protein
MHLYVNGDSHSAAAESVTPHVFAEDDGIHWELGRQPHPDNLRASYGCKLANWLGAVLHCDAESAGSNYRTMRTTRDWIVNNPDLLDRTFMVIQWSTWERQEWWINDQWWQVNASGIDHVPSDHQQRYKKFVAEVDWEQCTQRAHQEIWQFHQELTQQSIPHVFFNGNSHFASIADRHDWGLFYISPYNDRGTYDYILRHAGFSTVNPNSWHFGPAAHCFWAEFLLQYIKDNKLLDTADAISIN